MLLLGFRFVEVAVKTVIAMANGCVVCGDNDGGDGVDECGGGVAHLNSCIGGGGGCGECGGGDADGDECYFMGDGDECAR